MADFTWVLIWLTVVLHLSVWTIFRINTAVVICNEGAVWLAIHHPHTPRNLIPYALTPFTSLPASVIRSVNRQDECVQLLIHHIDILIVWFDELTVCYLVTLMNEGFYTKKSHTHF